MGLAGWVLLPLLAVAVLGVASALAVAAWLGAPTAGPPIGVYAAPRTALLVVDIQEDYTGPSARKRFCDGDRIVAAANTLIAQAQARNALVVYVQNVFANPLLSRLMGGLNLPGAPGTAMDRRLKSVPGAPTFAKTRGDAFGNPALDEYLRQNQVDRLLLVGLDGAHCVNSTARGALNRGYRVVLLEDGIATESGKSIAELARRWRAAGATVLPRMEW